jgi:hypothetical protein
LARHVVSLERAYYKLSKDVFQRYVQNSVRRSQG